jgi:hypothetical protein
MHTNTKALLSSFPRRIVGCSREIVVPGTWSVRDLNSTFIVSLKLVLRENTLAAV